MKPLNFVKITGKLARAVTLAALVFSPLNNAYADTPSFLTAQVEMQFIFGAPDAVPASPEVIDKILNPGNPGGENPGGGNPGNPGGNPGNPGGGTGNPPTQTGTTSQSENAACDTGFTGSKTRTRTATTWSDGTTTYGEWSSWNVTSCVPVPATVVSTATQSENAACDTGYTGQKSRTRTASTWSDGSVTYSAWSSWNLSACTAVPPTVIKTETQSESAACGTGYNGNQTRTRDAITYSNGTVAYGTWSAWSRAACVAAVVSTIPETQSQACAAGYSGNQTRSRTKTTWGDGRIEYSNWSAWNTSQCKDLRCTTPFGLVPPGTNMQIYRKNSSVTCTNYTFTCSAAGVPNMSSFGSYVWHQTMAACQATL